ncbi:CAP domain-containing protein [Halobacillus shinanisalinarum]|uniref:CAP domain-containing protein n=1 Tax=Halobacillus shinanisalinarum TaxID=2932258 RepID=A0ABY4H5Y7_9BACI|nr:CAP domain-containing protein [Halobacillus shinanisalinarum]UOQ95345.1 CAP domain-containing protein [Halobacillus shinanisalinarum]
MKQDLLLVFSALIMTIVLTACGGNNKEAVERESYNYNRVDFGPEQREEIGMGSGQDRFEANIPSEGGNSHVPMEDPEARDQDLFEADGDHLGTNRQRVDEVTGAFQEQVVQLTNQARKKEGLEPLKTNGELARVAQTKSKDMSKKNYFSHISPTYGSPLQMLKQFGIEFDTAAENIAEGQQTPDQVVKGWLDSPRHRKNIMNENVTEIGVGYTEDGQYWTQLFIGK